MYFARFYFKEKEKYTKGLCERSLEHWQQFSVIYRCIRAIVWITAHCIKFCSAVHNIASCAAVFSVAPTLSPHKMRRENGIHNTNLCITVASHVYNSKKLNNY